MDIKEEVRRRITDLTRFAYERGYRDGAQSALAEIEAIATEDVVEQLGTKPKPLEAIAETKAVEKKPVKVSRSRKRPAARETAAKPKQRKASPDGRKPKSIVVQEALQALLAANGEARRDEVLEAAQAIDPKVTKFDLSNGLRTLTKRSEIKVAPDDRSRLLPA